MYKELTECFRSLGVVMEHRTLVQRSSQSVQREPCSPIEQPGYVAQGSQLLMLWRTLVRAPLVVQPEDEAETRGALPEKVFNSSEG